MNIQNLDIGTSGNMKIVITDTGYDIEQNGVKKVSIPYMNNKPNTVGFITDHFGDEEGHSCSNHGYFKLSNIKINIKFNL